MIDRQLIVWVLALIVGSVIADKIPFVTIDERPSVLFFNGINDKDVAQSALRDGADSIVVRVASENDQTALEEYINLAIDREWERVVGLAIELQASELLPFVTEILESYGYNVGAPVFIISKDFNLLSQVQTFIPVADFSELLIENETALVDELVERGIETVIASKEQIQPYDREAQQLTYQTDLYRQLKEAEITIDICCFDEDPIATEFNGELINEIRHFMKLGGINVLTSKPAVAYAVATEFIASLGLVRTFDFAVISELPLPQENGQVDLNWKGLMNDLVSVDVDFVIQLGSTKHVSTNCSEEVKQFVFGEFQSSVLPFFYSPGENEWRDCDVSGTSNQEIKKREDLLINLFATGNTSLGQVNILISRQSDLAAIMPEFSEFPGNILWQYNDMLFVYPTVSDLVATPTSEPTANGEPETIVPAEGDSETTADQPPKSQVQYQATFAWLEFAFNEAMRRQSVGIVVVWHASEVFDSEKHGSGTVFADLRSRLEQLVMQFGKSVLIIHGGGTGFRMDKPLISTISGQSMETLTRVQASQGQWVRVQASPDASNLNDVFKITAESVDIEAARQPTIKASAKVDAFQMTDDFFSIGVMGGLPWGSHQDTWESLLTDISQANVEFVVHTGDIKGPDTNCSDTYFDFILDSFSEVENSLVYIPGDHDWATCNSEVAGGWDPFERLDYISDNFFADTQNSLGKYPMPVAPQATESITTLDLVEEIENGGSSLRIPNSMWTRDGILFATLHMIGQNNNLYRQPDDTEEIYMERRAEYQTRNAANLQFVKMIFDIANEDEIAGVLIFFNGNPFNGTLIDQNGWVIPKVQSGFKEVMDLIKNETLEYTLPVVLVHSDDQQFLIDQPFNQAYHVNDTNSDKSKAPQGVQNLQRVIVPGSDQVWWLKILINPFHPDVFFFHPVLVRTNLINHQPITPKWAADDPNKVCLADENQEPIFYPGW
eukprot:TRINITY_DN11021_c0_g2_i1.p1 TRINITY_DN11021_c0_g2~~TRINITY_DN11021_c0_g2_i1.p1  ORF type:complete len:953 (-),score=92.85 TRINITY_DN11021_c0_g2_i1:1949-4807(-)